MDTLPQTRPSLRVDGQEIPYQEGQTVLQAALAAGLKIPHLCYHPELEPIGSCRLCLVEVAGRTLAACTLPAADGQAVASASASAALRKHRQTLAGLLLAAGRHLCVSCERTGDCRLQETAADLNAPATPPSRSQDLPARDDSHPDVALDRGRCILCGICVQASQTLDGKNIFAFSGNGGQARLAVDSASGLLKDSAIAAEDHAIRLCPVGALIVKQDRAETGPGFSAMDFFDATDWNGAGPDAQP